MFKSFGFPSKKLQFHNLCNIGNGNILLISRFQTMRIAGILQP